MKVIVLILLLLNLVNAKDGIWVKVKYSKPIYREVKKTVPQRVCREYDGHHKHKIVKRCKTYNKVIYKSILDGYENSVQFKADGRVYNFDFFTDDRVNKVKIGVLNYK